MAKHDRIFPRLMIAMVRAGETGGFLDDALERIATNLEKDAALRGKIKSALTYPVIVLAFSGLMITAVLVFIVPIFEKMFKQLGGQLPLPTRIIVGISHALLWLGPLVAIIAVVMTLWIKAALRGSPAFRLKFDRLKLRVPVFGNLLSKMAISRFSRNLGTLLGVGVPVMQSLDVVGETTGNAVITEAMIDVQDSVRQGRTISGPARLEPVLPGHGHPDDRGRRGERPDQRDARQDRRLLRPRSRSGGRGTDRRDRTDHGAAHGRHRRLDGRLPLPADVLHLQPHPGCELMTAAPTPQISVSPGTGRTTWTPVPVVARSGDPAGVLITPESPRRLTMIGKLQKMRQDREEGDRGFTLIELLVVVVIIGVLIAIAIPLYLNYRKGAENKSAASDLRGGISTLEQCYTDSNSTYPTGIDRQRATPPRPDVTCSTSGAVINLSSGNALTYCPPTGDCSGAGYIHHVDPHGTNGVYYCYASAAGGSVTTESTANCTAKSGYATRRLCP